MNTYNSNFTFNQQRKKTKKLLTTLGIILVICFILISIVGIISGSNSAESQNINAAIAENTQLKQQIEEQKIQIEELNAKIAQLTQQIENGVVVEEEPYMPEETQGEEGVQALEEHPTTPRDEINNQ